MSITELGSLGEFIGAFLLFASLVYVGIQIRQSNQTDKMNARIAFEDQYRNTVAFFASTHEIADVVAKGLEDPSALTPSEAHLFGPRLYALYRHAEIAFDQYNKQLLDEQFLDRTMKVLEIYHYEPGAQWWFYNHGKAMLSSEFHEYVEKRLASQG